jgi:hypothetical protein
VYFGPELARYAGEAQEDEVEPRYISSANMSESLREEEARLSVELAYIRIGAYRRI